MDTPFVQEILIEEPVKNHPFTEQALIAQIAAQKKRPNIRVIDHKDQHALQDTIKKIALEQDLSLYQAGKKVLLLKSARGQQFRTCPGAELKGTNKRVVCCNYYVFNFLSGCPLNCSYCYLGSYLNQYALSMQVNIEDPLKLLTEVFNQSPKHFFRLGTGELADSLALPASDPLNRYLVETFAHIPNSLIEFKTKSDRVDELTKIDSRGRAVISWSLSPKNRALDEEHATASIEARLHAAQKIKEAGYLVAFHLDPLIYDHADFSSWQREYHELIDLIFDMLPPEKIAWFSMGGLRLIKGLKAHMQQEFPKSTLAYQEFVQSDDGKERYPKNLRNQMFQSIATYITGHNRVTNAPPIYLCMEQREIWQQSLGKTPDAQGSLHTIFNHTLPQPLTL